MHTLSQVDFHLSNLGATLDCMPAAQMDALEFGVIGFDSSTVVAVYNQFESDAAGLSCARVLGRPLFTDVAPCMNNFMVAQRFDDALRDGVALDEKLNYVLTLRMRPVKVVLRLLATPGTTLRYVLVDRASSVSVA